MEQTPPVLRPFESKLRTQVIYGPGSLERLADAVRLLNTRRVLLVTDRGVAAAGHVARAVQVLTDAGFYVAVFDDVQENPTSLEVDRCVEFARLHAIDCIVGLGGGSAMDCAKGCNFIYTNGGTMRDYWGYGKATKPMLPMVLVPTTAGTGSEAQSYALIIDPQTHRKMACGAPGAAARFAILDPALTLSCPPRVTAAAGLDAVSHAVESFVCRAANALSRLFAAQALRLLAESLPRVLVDGQDLEARAATLLAANWAGTAIEHSMLGAAHAAANPLTRRYGTTHGVAVALLLPHVVRFNAPVAGADYAELLRLADIDRVDSAVAGEVLAEYLSELAHRAGIRPTEVPLREGDLIELAEDAASQWTARFNPRPITRDDFVELYRGLLARTTVPEQ